jgi:prevent-host-death family protein
MATYSVAEAKNRLPALIAAAERGEQVTITRYGKPVVELKPVAQRRKPMTPEEHDAFWRDVDALNLPPSGEDSGTLVDRMREADVDPEVAKDW